MKKSLTADVLQSQSVVELPERDLFGWTSLITTGNLTAVLVFLNNDLNNLHINNIRVLDNNHVNVDVDTNVDADNLCAQVVAIASTQCHAELF